MRKPNVGITIGDFNGIGPEVVREVKKIINPLFFLLE